MDETYQLIHADCMDVVADMAPASIDAIVTDPPYGLSFMGKDWDHGVPGERFWTEFLRVAKPGSYLLAFGGTRTFHRLTCAIEDAGWEIRDCVMWVYGGGRTSSKNRLKPAVEPITMGRKPLVGTVEENVRMHGTGALKIDACRVPVSGGRTRGESATTSGRWPANLIHDGSDEVVGLFPETTSGVMKAGQQRKASKGLGGYHDGMPDTASVAGTHGDSGSAARFFYCAKAGPSERGEMNNHPTVKPVELMRYLCRLVTPPGGTILDPFMGSGSTGIGAMLEGFRFIGIEREAEYHEIARRRMASWRDAAAAAGPEAKASDWKPPAPKAVDPRQGDLFGGDER